MKIEQRRWSKQTGWSGPISLRAGRDDTLVFVFGAPYLIENAVLLGEAVGGYEGAHILGASTAGEIFGSQVTDDSVVTCAIRFEKTTIRAASVRLADFRNGVQAGEALVGMLATAPEPATRGGGAPLRHVFVLSDGLQVNGSDLVAGLSKGLPTGVSATGGMSADGARFVRTSVIGDRAPESGIVAAVGLYGEALRVGSASMGGWDCFGPERLITRSMGNRLYELDGVSALALYKKYLGSHAAELPASGLLFPLSLRTGGGKPPLVRTILGIDEREQCMIFAGDMPEGCFARLMKANFDRLIDGAVGAAKAVGTAQVTEDPDFALLISCVGRKIVLKQRIEEETEGVREVLGERVILTGFYSYGEISPFTPGGTCELHNQTMTITTLKE